MNSFGTILVRVGLVAALATGYLAATGTATASTPGQEAVKTSAVQAPHGAYAGTATCLTCHEDRGAALTKGPHSHAFRAGTPTAPSGCQACHGETKAAMGCEGCHGPGKEHAEASGDKTNIRRFASLSPRDASETCVSCHFRQKHTFWAGSQHDQRNVGCTTCHSIHKAAGEKQMKAASETELCAQCHRTIVNKQLKFAHMPVREGKMSCSSCHNVHGSSNARLLKAGTTEEERRKRFEEFWEKNNPIPGAKTNRAMIEYYSRVSYANEHFRHFIEGWKTDRGMIYIIYGPPNYVDRHPSESDTPPYEIWEYYDVNKRFTFIDETGFGDYRLRYPIWDDRNRLR